MGPLVKQSKNGARPVSLICCKPVFYRLRLSIVLIPVESALASVMGQQWSDTTNFRVCNIYPKGYDFATNYKNGWRVHDKSQ